MSSKITWTNERRKLKDLKPWDRNPRFIGEDEGRRLEESLDAFGQIQTIAIDPSDEILDGHQRKAVWAAAQKYGPDYKVDVRVSSRALTEKEREKLVVMLHKGTTGEWNFDILANEFEVNELMEWGFAHYELGIGAPEVDRSKEWEGMPECRQDNLKSWKSIKIHFVNATDLKAFAELIGQPLTEKTKSIWYPKAEIDVVKDTPYIDES